MARAARLYLPNTAQLVLVRGINKSVVFHSEQDYQKWHDILRIIAPTHQVAIHAYALIEHSIYLLVTAEHDKALGKLMQDLGRRYVRHINNSQNRTGTLWEGRYRTAYLQDSFIINAYLWLDSMSTQTSGLHHEGVTTIGFIRDHEQYWTIGNTPFERQHAYRQLLNKKPNSQTIIEFEHAVITGWALGDKVFLKHAECISGQRFTPAPRGRPKKPRNEP